MTDLALCYITRGRREILASWPAAGGPHEPQVPTVAVEPRDPIVQAAVRGARAQTGLDLGNGEWIGRRGAPGSDSRSLGGHWNFVWLEAPPQTPDSWVLGTARMTFVPLEGARLRSPMAALMPRLWDRLACEDVAVCYITRGSELLVFDGHPGGGVQVAAGKVEPGELPEQAATREAYEEAGLTLGRGRFIGTQEWHHRSRTDVHEFRYYYWFRDVAGKDAWQHRVSAGVADAGRIYHHRFVPAAAARIDWDLDTYLPALVETLA